MRQETAGSSPGMVGTASWAGYIDGGEYTVSAPTLAGATKFTTGRAIVRAGVSQLPTHGLLSKGGFGAKGLYQAPAGMADNAVRAAYLKEVNSLSFKVKLGIHNLFTPFHRRVSVATVREAVENGAFGRGAFTVRNMDDGRFLFGGSGTRTFLNRQFFHHELIHVSQMIKNPNLWKEFPLRLVHEFVQLPTAHGATFWPTSVVVGWGINELTDGD